MSVFSSFHTASVLRRHNISTWIWQKCYKQYLSFLRYLRSTHWHSMLIGTSVQNRLIVLSHLGHLHSRMMGEQQHSNQGCLLWEDWSAALGHFWKLIAEVIYQQPAATGKGPSTFYPWPICSLQAQTTSFQNHCFPGEKEKKFKTLSSNGELFAFPSLEGTKCPWSPCEYAAP